jgi:dynein heavy chain
LSSRFVRHFSQLCIPPPSDAAIKTILTTILGGFLADWPADLRALCTPIVASAVEAYNRVSAELLPTPAKSHYTFNLRDLSKVAQVCPHAFQWHGPHCAPESSTEIVMYVTPSLFGCACK